ncbi:arylsulfatase [Arenimonas sp.]|jgi:arylsulfatase A-like enzyme|uniref:arylsulfatase n=1 Tax=Arenimonas sp. TaxID=1872635 RepID=UPI0037C0386A
MAAQKKPNFLILWGDDIGWFNISANNHGMMGYKTPNIDSIAKDGAMFTDWYGQQSCTAGRACFLTGQSGFRTGMLKVGLPGAKEGLQARDVTIAELLKAQGYMTAQFGKNHLGDADETLPTAHGFDEFFGSLYHLNAEQEPECEDYFKDPEMIKKYATRGVIHCWANPDGTQRIESTGPLNKKRMETIDEEVTAFTLDYLEKAAKSDKPFFLWWNSTRMHIFTHLKEESRGVTGLGTYPDGMVEHDGHVGQILNKLKELGLDDNTIVMYSTDNGAECFTWPDGGTTPFRGEKNENWEGGYRVPCFLRWPGVIKPGTINNDIFSHEDMLPTILAAAGVPDVKEQLLKGMKVGDKTFKVHIDGYNQLDALAGKVENPRKEFFYWNDDGSLVALRYNQWKIVFQEQREHGFAVWAEPFVQLRVPKLFNLRTDPFEIADKVAMDYDHWRLDRVFMFVPAQDYIAKYIATFKEFPPSQKVGSFSLDMVLESLASGQKG